MAFIQSFSVSQVIGLPNSITLTDNSTGTDAAIVSRRVYLITDAGLYLVPTGTTTNYIDWLLANASISIAALDKDYSLLLRVEWLDVNNVVLYTKDVNANFEMYNADFEYSLVSDEANGNASLNSPNWLMSRIKLRLSLDDASNAVSFASSITNGQAANERGTYLRLNKNLFY